MIFMTGIHHDHFAAHVQIKSQCPVIGWVAIEIHSVVSCIQTGMFYSLKNPQSQAAALIVRHQIQGM